MTHSYSDPEKTYYRRRDGDYTKPAEGTLDVYTDALYPGVVTLRGGQEAFALGPEAALILAGQITKAAQVAAHAWSRRNDEAGAARTEEGNLREQHSAAHRSYRLSGVEQCTSECRCWCTECRTARAARTDAKD
jgi:hypothetical protein